MPMLILGLDIGVTGAIASLTRNALLQRIDDIPVMARGNAAASVKMEINPSGLAALIREVMQQAGVGPDDTMAVFERVAGMPGQNSASTFSLGDSNGAIRAVLAVLGIPYKPVTPAQWKGHFNIRAEAPPKKAKGEVFTAEQESQRKRERAAGKSMAKERARAMVIQLYPGISSSVSRKSDHNRAEAVLIARYGQEKLT